MTKQPTDQGGPLRPLRREQTPVAEDAPMAALFAQVDPLDPLPEIAVVRIRRRVDRALGDRARSRLPLWLKVSLVAAVSLFVLEAAAATTLTAWPSLRQRLLGGLSGPSPARQPVPVLPPTVSPSQPTPPATAIVAPMPDSAPVPAPSKPPRLRQSMKQSARSALPPPTAAPPTEPDDPDVALYTRALSQLNVEHDAMGALGTLEAYRFQHPNGLFRGEAMVAEVRAELLLGRDAEALTLLDAMQARGFAGVPQASELGLLRAELLGRADRCKDAVPVLSHYLTPALPTEQRERAIYARATCRAQLQNIEGSRSDLREYLREFPQGRFAGQARQRLDRLP